MGDNKWTNDVILPNIALKKYENEEINQECPCVSTVPNSASNLGGRERREGSKGNS